jgi:hypothetical protein
MDPEPQQLAAGPLKVSPNEALQQWVQQQFHNQNNVVDRH